MTKIPDSDWTWKKPAVYCRAHGLRIRGVLNGKPLCQKCIVNYGDKSDQI